MISLAANIALGLLALALLLAVWRLLLGPSVSDRILALDTIYINALALLIVLGVRLNDPLFFEEALLIGLLGFVGTVSFAKYLLRGDIID